MPKINTRPKPIFAQRIREFRLQKQIAVENAAERAQISPIYWYHIEEGIKTNPTLDVLQKMAAALGCQVADFFTEENHAA